MEFCAFPTELHKLVVSLAFYYGARMLCKFVLAWDKQYEW